MSDQAGPTGPQHRTTRPTALLAAAPAQARPSIAPMLRRAGAGLADLLYPPECPACGAETADRGALCAACFADIWLIAGPVCSICGRPEAGLAEPGVAAGGLAARDLGARDLGSWDRWAGGLAPARHERHVCDACRAAPPAFDAARAVAVYAGTARRLVLALKHADRLDTAPMLAAWMARAAAPWLAAADAVVPVPLHWRRRLDRRANQSEELARALCAHAGRTDAFAPWLLRRSRATPSQGGLDGAARRANLRGALAVPAWTLRQGRTRLAGARVLIVDDVMTSGATLDEAARALRQAGAAHVNAIVVALAHRPSPPYVPAVTQDPAAD